MDRLPQRRRGPVSESIYRFRERRRQDSPSSFLSNANGDTIAWSPDGTYLLFDIVAAHGDRQVLARVDLVPRTPQFREDQFRDLFAARRAPARRPAGAAARGAAARHARRSRADSAPRRGDKVDADRLRGHSPPRSVSCRSVSTCGASSSARTARRRCSTPRPRARRTSTPISLDELANGTAVARQLTSTPGFKQGAQFSPDAKEVYYLENGRIERDQRRLARRTVHRRLGRARRRLRAERSSPCSTRRGAFLPTTSSTPQMNGVDWRALEERRYEPYAAGAQSTEDLRRIMRLMIGELNASHSGVERPDLLAAAQRRPARRALRSRRVRAARQACA